MNTQQAILFGFVYTNVYVAEKTHETVWEIQVKKVKPLYRETVVV